MFRPYNTLHKYCWKDECRTTWIETEKAKQWEKRKRQVKEELQTIQDLVKIAQQVFNAYIRKRDEGNKCISCYRVPVKKNAGHFYSSGGHWSVRFDERNVHLQCEHCNTFLSGNLINYRENLIKKLGYDEFERLSSEAMKTRNFTKDELKEIIKTYKQKIKEL